MSVPVDDDPYVHPLPTSGRHRAPVGLETADGAGSLATSSMVPMILLSDHPFGNSLLFGYSPSRAVPAAARVAVQDVGSPPRADGRLLAGKPAWP